MKGISSFEEIVNYNYFSSKMESQSETSREKARKASRELIKSRNDTSGKVRPIFLSLNLREWSMNVISRFTIRWNREIRDWQFSLFFVILSEKLANCCVISSEIAKIRGIGNERDWQFRTEVKRDSVKYQTLLSRVNFPWMWVHWAITSSLIDM